MRDAIIGPSSPMFRIYVCRANFLSVMALLNGYRDSVAGEAVDENLQRRLAA